MKLIVGLGNPGHEYLNSRHNIGFMIVDFFAKKSGLDWNFDKKFNSEIAKSGEVIIAKPRTFMNKSGDAVSKIVNYYQVAGDELIVIHDDIDLELGKLRFRRGMSSGGHNGVEDIIQKLGTKEFWRLKVGIGRPENEKMDVEDWVLSSFSSNEREKIFAAVKNFDF